MTSLPVIFKLFLLLQDPVFVIFYKSNNPVFRQSLRRTHDHSAIWFYLQRYGFTVWTDQFICYRIYRFTLRNTKKVPQYHYFHRNDTMKLILRKEQRRGLRISALLPAHNQITAPQFIWLNSHHLRHDTCPGSTAVHYFLYLSGSCVDAADRIYRDRYGIADFSQEV